MPVADSAEDVLLRDAHVVVDDLAVVRGRPAPDADAAHDLHALRGGRHDELRHGAFAPLGRLVAVGHAGHHDEEVGVDAVRGDTLVAVYPPVVAVEPGAGGAIGRAVGRARGCLYV